VLDTRHPSRHLIIGVVILILGVILLLDQLGFLEADKIFLFWPLILIYFGVTKMQTRRNPTGAFWGAFLVLLGISFQLEELGLSHIRFGTIWPVFLICVGILLILQRYERHGRWYPPTPGVPPGGPEQPGNIPPGSIPPPGDPGQAGSNFAPGADASEAAHSSEAGNARKGYDPTRAQWANAGLPWSPPSPGPWYDSSEPRLNVVNIFWGGKRRLITKRFVGGEIVTIFGGFDIDLTQSDIQGTQTQIDVVTIFGGGDIRVPPNWEVVLETVGIFGGCGDRTLHPEQQKPSSGSDPAAPVTKRLIIKGVAIFGGLNIKN
jgi:predicted membrane protein